VIISETGVRLFRHLHEHLAVAILLATLVCLPARCQDVGSFALRQIAEAPAPYPVKNFLLLPYAELSSRQDSAGPQNTQSRSSDGAFKKTIWRFGRVRLWEGSKTDKMDADEQVLKPE
jgi:hypothetical protein